MKIGASALVAAAVIRFIGSVNIIDSERYGHRRAAKASKASNASKAPATMETRPKVLNIGVTYAAKITQVLSSRQQGQRTPRQPEVEKS